MSIIKLEIKKEQAKIKPDLHYLKILKSLEKESEITFDMFSNTGRIVPLEVFKAEDSNKVVDSDCTDVVRYLGGFYIQMLKSGSYLYEYFFEDSKTLVKTESVSLDVVELHAWISDIKEKINK